LSKEVEALDQRHQEKVPKLSALKGKLDQFHVDVQNRGGALTQELARQQSHEQLRHQFADTAKALNSLMWEESSAINAHVAGDLQEQLENVQKHKPVIIGAQAQLDALENLHLRMQEAQVFDNPHTDLNFPTLKTNYDQLVKATNAKESLIQKEIIQKIQLSRFPSTTG